jgi:hypothetical protein
MSTNLRDDTDTQDLDCDDSSSLATVLLATSSGLLLGYLVGRVSYSRDLRAALRRIEESPEPIVVSIPTL